MVAKLKPLHRAQERDEALVEQGLRTDYPKIKALAQREKAEIFFGDAAHMRSDHHAGRTWGKRGETPIVETTGARHRMSLISAITARGHMRFMIKDKGGVNAAVFIEFLKRLMAGAKRAIFLIVDRGPAHIAKKTRAFVDSQHGRLRLFFLPPYSPDRNPDELVWKHLKAYTVGRMTITDKADFKAKVRASMRQLQNDPEKIRSFYQNHRSNMPPESAFTYGLINNPAHGLKPALIHGCSRQAHIKQCTNDGFAKPSGRDARLQIGHPALHQFTMQGTLSSFTEGLIGGGINAEPGLDNRRTIHGKEYCLSKAVTKVAIGVECRNDLAEHCGGGGNASAQHHQRALRGKRTCNRPPSTYSTLTC